MRVHRDKDNTACRELHALALTSGCSILKDTLKRRVFFIFLTCVADLHTILSCLYREDDE